MTTTITIEIGADGGITLPVYVNVDGYTYHASTPDEAAGAVEWIEQITKEAQEAKKAAEPVPSQP